MPLLIYGYCALISLSALYGIHILKPKATYLGGVFLFVVFCWLICIDYYVTDVWIFNSQIALIIYFICAIFWQLIEVKALQPHLNTNKDKNSATFDALQQEFGENGLGYLTYTLIAVVAIFYLPIIYMGYDLFISIPDHAF